MYICQLMYIYTRRISLEETKSPQFQSLQFQKKNCKFNSK